MQRRTERLNQAVALLHRLESAWDGLRRRWHRPMPVRVVPYLGLGDEMRLWLRLRVLADEALPEPEPEGTVWRNVRRMLRRFRTREVPEVEVAASSGGQRTQATTDEEGFAELALESLAKPPGQGLRTHAIALSLPDYPAVRATGHALVVPPEARLGIVSDIDDTVLVTGAHTLWLNLYTSLTNSARSRIAFPGVAAFYQAVQRGGGDMPLNPVFYVSSSPWNLYDLLERFMELRGIPKGPMFLRDLGISAEGLTLKGGHGRHKIGAIERVLAYYPGLSFILIGDSGQHDALIYKQIVERYPNRIRAVYLRDVIEGDEKDREAKALLDEVTAKGVSAVFCPNLVRAAEHAAAEGWITADDLARVQAEVDRTEIPADATGSGRQVAVNTSST